MKLHGISFANKSVQPILIFIPRPLLTALGAAGLVNGRLLICYLIKPFGVVCFGTLSSKISEIPANIKNMYMVQ